MRNVEMKKKAENLSKILFLLLSRLYKYRTFYIAKISKQVFLYFVAVRKKSFNWLA